MEDRKCIGSVCYTDRTRHVTVKGSPQLLVIYSLLVIVIPIFLVYILAAYFGIGKFVVDRFISISYVSWVIGALGIIWNIRILKAIFLSVLPMYFFFLIVILLQSHREEIDPAMAFINHIPHLIIAILLLIDKELRISETDILIAGVFWIAEVTLAYTLFPSFKMFYIGDYKAAILAVLSAVFTSEGIVDYLNHRRSLPIYLKKKSRKH